MKGVSANRLIFLVCGLCLALAISLSQSGGKTHAASVTCGNGASCPTMNATGGDIFAGGWFDPDCSTYYQDYLPGDSSSIAPDTGGISTYATEDGSGNGTGGSSSQYGAFALGAIDGVDSTDWGFISGTAVGGSRSVLSFANYNNANGSWGGDFEGANQQSHCIPDYYDSQQSVTSPPTSLASGTLDNFNNLNLNDAQYTVTDGGALTIGDGTNPVTVSAGTNLTIFVKGDVYIDSNIVYGSYNATNIPKFALVVEGGDIYIASNVTEIDGWYIAQPTTGSGTPTSDDGIIWTCHGPGTATTLQNTDIDGCTNVLTVNGALVAKYVDFTRINPNLVGSAVSYAPNQLSPMEVINFTPEMVIGGSFFGASSGPQITSLQSLPPVY